MATNMPIYIFCSSFTNWGALIEHYVDRYPFEIENRIKLIILTMSESKASPVSLCVAHKIVIGIKITLATVKIGMSLFEMLNEPPIFLPIVSNTLNMN